ncbi:MAG: hypothetical protein JWO67_5377 [Streptosporangiaceae bacterium]|nr:hypothetical protein [Streptosporangiaceae bacterium]
MTEIEDRLAELERQVEHFNHSDLTDAAVAWIAEVAKHGAITGQTDLAFGNPYGPRLQWTIFPDGKIWLQVCDMNMCPIWRITLTGTGKVPADA